MQKNYGKYISTALLLGAVVLTGCTAKVETQQATPEPVAQATEVTEKLPQGCTSNSVVVKSDEAGEQKISKENAYFLQWTKDSGAIVLANYEVNPDSIYSDITDGRVLTVVKLSRVDLSSFALGTYLNAKEIKGEDDKMTPVNERATEFNISTVDLAGAVFDKDASVEIKYLGDDYVCGEIKADDGSSSIKGDFVAQFVNKIM